MRPPLLPTTFLVILTVGSLLGCADRKERRRRSSPDSEPPGAGRPGAPDIYAAVQTAQAGIGLGLDQALAATCIKDVRARARRDLERPDLPPEEIEILTGGADLDGDGEGDTVAMVFLEQRERHLGIYLSRKGCTRFAGDLVAARTTPLEETDHGVRAIRTWTDAVCRDGLGGELVTWRFDGARYVEAETIVCPCGAEAARDKTCPQP